MAKLVERQHKTLTAKRLGSPLLGKLFANRLGLTSLETLRGKRLGTTPLARIVSVSLALKGLLIAYLLCWAVVYRLPHSPPAFVDIRSSIHERPYYVAICAGLASNIHGFPGHGYVVWSESPSLTFSECDSRGFVPAKCSDQIPSLFHSVPGLLVSNASDGNMRNLDAVVAIVDKQTFLRSKQTSRSWNSDSFKVGSSDCVAYANSIAESVGLRLPDTSFKYPQDYIAQLKKLNWRKDAVSVVSLSDSRKHSP